MKTLVTKTTSPKEVLDKGYVRRLTPDATGGYVASILEFPGCVAEGETAEEALHNLDNAAESWIEVARAHGREIREPIDFEGCSGKFALRMPRTLHRQVAELAELEGCSVNQLLVAAISHYVGGKQTTAALEAFLRPQPFASYYILISGSPATLAGQFSQLASSDFPKFPGMASSRAHSQKLPLTLEHAAVREAA